MPLMPQFSKDLLSWFKKYAREMPWRGEKNPYKIWLSEIMLQQTQVDTVRPYYERWLKKFPTVASVARAKEDEVLKLWEGLGYYARCRNFQKACQQVVKDFNGKVPSRLEDLKTLKGIGPYTLAAVGSIAFGHVVACIDGNIKRVIARVLALDVPPSQGLLQIETFLNKNISKKYPGTFNEALMDLGATICVPKNPKCLICPVQKHCKAFETKTVDVYPKPEKKLERPHYQIAVGVVWKGNKILVSKRKSKGLLGGLWEFPGGKIQKGETSAACAAREVKEEVGVDVEVGSSIGKIKHQFTHFSIEMEAFVCKYMKGRPRAIECEAWKWIQLQEISNFAFPKANHKLFPKLPKTNPFLRGRKSDPLFKM